MAGACICAGWCQRVRSCWQPNPLPTWSELNSGLKCAKTASSNWSECVAAMVLYGTRAVCVKGAVQMWRVQVPLLLWQVLSGKVSSKLKAPFYVVALIVRGQTGLHTRLSVLGSGECKGESMRGCQRIPCVWCCDLLPWQWPRRLGNKNWIL